MRPRRETLVAALGALACACAGSPEFEGPAEPHTVLEAKVEGLEHRTVRLRFEVAGATPRTERAIDAWFTESLTQSSWLDVEPTAGPGDAVVVRGELGVAGSGTLTTTWEPGEGRSVPLAGVRGVDPGNLPDAIDRIARETRVTLGEPKDAVRASGRACAALVSPMVAVAAACAEARRLVRDRQLPRADDVLRRALRTDPACALALSLAAGVRMDQGRPKRAVDLAQKVTQLADRASPSATHRAQRVLLLASRAGYDSLVTLADEAARTRPRDPQIQFTRALGQCLQGSYAEARPELEKLRRRLPDSPGVLFCLGHARLATGDPKAALELLPEVEARVPALPAGRLRAWVLLALGRHDELEEHFDRLAGSGSMRMREGQIALLGMRAAHAILRGTDRKAGDLLLEQLDRLRSAPSILTTRGDLLVDAAWVLTRIGRTQDCDAMLGMLWGGDGLPEPTRAPGMVADAHCRLASKKTLSPERLQHLEVVGLRAWRLRLEARLALRRGDPARALLLLTEAMKRSDDPALVLEYAEALRAGGRVDESSRMLAALAKELDVPRMAAPARHRLIRPKLALVWREARGAR